VNIFSVLFPAIAGPVMANALYQASQSSHIIAILRAELLFLNIVPVFRRNINKGKIILT